MADETNKNFGDDLKDDAKDFAKEAKQTANEFAQDAKEAANEFKESWNESTNNGENKKLICGILAIVIGWTGVHKFMLGYTKEGILQILLTLLCGVGAIIALIEGIIYLTKTDEEFYQTYQVGHKGWF
jgi:TM2 domain-containing membrane protein YozV